MNIEKINPNTKFIGKNKIYYESLDSTNTVAKSVDCVDGTVIIANEQTNGRGRMGRVWQSSKDEGISMSIVLKPRMSVKNISFITLIVGISACKTLNEFADNRFKIKWPNDIVYEGKKVCGILVECVTNLDSTKIIAGIGINVNTQKFPADLKICATSLCLTIGSFVERELVVSRFLELFEEYYSLFTGNEIEKILDEYKKNCVNLGREVFAVKDNESIKGIAVDITENGELVIKKEDGTLLNVNSGEVSIRGIYGYI